MAMSRKHFCKLAEALAVVKPLKTEGERSETYAERFVVWSNCVREVADVCSSENGMFDCNRFFAACGYEPNR